MHNGIFGAVACVLLLGGAPAMAATPDAGTRTTTGGEAPIVVAQRGDRGDRGMHDGRRGGPRVGGPGYHDRGRQFRGGRDMRGPPPGWRRYHARPRGWQTMGCSQIGPIWYCP